MPIAINAQELNTVLEVTPDYQNIMLIGRHGIGKSQILTNHFEAKGMTVITLFLGQMSDPGDLLGLPTKDEHTGKTNFMPPYWFPIDGTPIVLFLDELNRARPEILQTVMDLVLNRKLAGRPLPKGSRIISACNDGEEYQLTFLDPALVSRFNIYSFRPTVQDWLLWAAKAGIDERIINFIQQSPECLELEKAKDEGIDDSNLEKTPDRRAWERVSSLLKPISKPLPIHQKIVAGVIGPQAAVKLFRSFASDELKAMDVLTNFVKWKPMIEALELHKLTLLNEGICRFFETNDVNDVEEKTLTKNLTSYHNYLHDNNREAYAHFVSQLSNAQYKHILKFINKQMPKAYKEITQFILDL